MVPKNFQVAPGIGLIPVDWQLKTGDEITLKISKGTTPPKLDISDTGEIPFLRVNNLSFNGTLDKNSSYIFVSRSAHEGFLARSKAYPGDILMNIVGPPLGKTALLDNEYPEYNMNQAIVFFRVNDTLIDQKYFLAYINSQSAQEWFQSRSKKTSGQQNLTIELAKQIPVPIPCIREQKRIAQILSAWNKAITTTEKLLANSQQQKKALMQQLLTGKTRLPGVKGEWIYKSISQIATRVQRKVDDKEHPILTISSLSGFVTQEERYSRYMAGESVKNYILLKKGEFAYNKGNSKTFQYGCIFDLESFDSGLVPHVYVCFKLKEGLSHKYFKYLFEADYLKSQLGALVNTGVRNNGLLNIKPSEFMATNVPVPSFYEQEKIADVLHAITLTINSLQNKLEHLKQEKRALMQQLLTGKRRIKI